MNATELKRRTRQFSMGVTCYVESRRVTPFILNVRNQVIRSAASVGANYHEACRARSKKEFISKIELVLQELEETSYWLTLLYEYGCDEVEVLRKLMDQASELTAIMTASARTAKRFYNRTS